VDPRTIGDVVRLYRALVAARARARRAEAALAGLGPGDAGRLVVALDNCVKLLEPDRSLEDAGYRAEHGAAMLDEARALVARLARRAAAAGVEGRGERAVGAGAAGAKGAPPSESQLREKLDWLSRPGASLHNDEVIWLIRTIRDLRVLCGEAAKHNDKLAHRLGGPEEQARESLWTERLAKAKKGEV
jgi:hypothetical protein